MKKKVFAVFLALTMLTGAVGCGNSQQTEENKGEAETNSASGNKTEEGFEGTISIACSSVEAEGLKAVLKEYQKKNPNVELDTIVTQSVTDFETMMTGWVASNTMPDMYIAQVGAVEQGYAANGYLESLTDTGLMDSLVTGDTSLITYDGDLYAFPTTQAISAVIVNNSVLKEAGIEYGVDNYPTNWSEFLELCQKLVDAGIEAPVGIAGQDASSVTAWTFQYVYQTIYGKNPNWYADILRGKAAWNDELYREMFEKYSDMIPYMAEDVLGTSAETLKKRFITGEAPIIFGTTADIGGLKQLDPELDALMLPSCFTDESEKQTLISSFDAGVSITKNAKNKDLCFDFLKFLASSEGMTAFCNATSYFPTVKEHNVDLDPAFDVVADILQGNKLPNSPVLSREWIPGIKEIMKTGQQNWLSGEDVDTVVNSIQEEHERLMEADPDWVENFLNNYTDK